MNLEYDPGDLQCADAEQGVYVAQGTYTSAIYDAGRDDVVWGNVSWDEDLPTDCEVRLQVGVATAPEGPWVYVGPDGTPSTFFSTPSGEALYSPTIGRYCRYRAYMSGPSTLTPSFGNVQISHDGLNESRVTFWEYDPAGNRTRQTRVTDAGVETEVTDDASWPPEDRINTLNQVMRRDVLTGAGTVTWRYGWDEDGNHVSKTDGTDTLTRIFDEDNRLLSESRNDVLQVSFTYDIAGRMLSRTSYSEGVADVPSQFRWDGWDLVAEIAPDSTITRYFSPQGVLHSFERAGVSYFCHCDELGSIRSITNASGVVISHFECDAWGNLLASAVDGLPGGFSYRFIGARGCRFEELTGLVYMRQRWFDGEHLGRFVSRDPLATELNRYTYGMNSPTNYIDPTGLWIWIAVWLEQAAYAAGAGLAVGAAIRWWKGEEVCDPAEMALDAGSSVFFTGALAGLRNVVPASAFRPAIDSANAMVRSLASSAGFSLSAARATAGATLKPLIGKASEFFAASGQPLVSNGQQAIKGLVEYYGPPLFRSTRQASANSGWHDAERKVFEYLAERLSRLTVGTLSVAARSQSGTVCEVCEGTAIEFARRYPGVSVRVAAENSLLQHKFMAGNVCSGWTSAYPTQVAMSTEDLWIEGVITEACGHHEIAEFLRRGGDVDLCHPKSKRTLLHIACEHRNLELIRLLVSKGANVNARDICAWTPLHVAVDIDSDAPWQITHETDPEQYAFETVRLLLSLGANPSLRDGEGRTPRDLIANGHPALLPRFDRVNATAD